jgi:hypothetical protein
VSVEIRSQGEDNDYAALFLADSAQEVLDEQAPFPAKAIGVDCA